jgi:hypothetical protein
MFTFFYHFQFYTLDLTANCRAKNKHNFFFIEIATACLYKFFEYHCVLIKSLMNWIYCS